MSDIEEQLQNLSMNVEQPVKKEDNECLYLCKQCKWNIMIIIFSGGLIVLTGFNIAFVIQINKNNLMTQYFITNICIECITWIIYVSYYITNYRNLLYILKLMYTLLTSFQCWGISLLINSNFNEVSYYVGINIILTIWYMYFIHIMHIHN